MLTTYNISDFSPFYNKEDEFLVVPFGELNQQSKLVWPHKHNYYEIVWIKEGRSKHIIDDHTIDLFSDIIFFMSPGQVHVFEEYDSVKGDCLMFTEEFFILNFTNKEALQKLSFLNKSFKLPYVELNKETKTVLAPVLKLIYAEFSRKDYSKLVLSSLLYVFLNSMQRNYNDQKEIHNALGKVDVFTKFKEMVDFSFKTEKSVSYYASRLFVTPHQLNKIVKTIAGSTTTEIIHERTMLEAKRMLVHTQLPIGQIADQLGFKDFSYFSRQFKKHNGITPDKYRISMHSKYNL